MADKTKKIIIILALLIFALSIRIFPTLDQHGLNMMEIDYIYWAKNLNGYEFILNSIANHHGLISPYIIKLWMNMPPIKNNDFHIRLPSIIFFMVLLGILVLITYRELTFKERVISGFFLSINCMLVAFSRNGRLLPLYALLIFITTIYLYRNLIEPNRKNAILLFVFSTLSLFNHPLSTIFISSTVIGGIFVFSLNKNFIKGILPLIISVLLYLPIFLWYIKFGRVESELIPINKKIILSWFVFLFDDIDTMLIFIFLLISTKTIKNIKNDLIGIWQNNLVRFIAMNILIGLLLMITISIFLPLTRQYYIIPLTVFSSILIGAFCSRQSPKILVSLILILSIKAVFSFCIADKNTYRFESSYGAEKEILQKFRDTIVYKNINKEKTIFINLPLYYTRAFDYYKQPKDRYLPEINKFGYIEEILNPEDIINLKTKNEFYLIQWYDCNKLADFHQSQLCNINARILKTQFNKIEMVWEYEYRKGVKTSIYHLKD